MNSYCKAARGATSGGNKKHSKRWHRAQLNQASKAKAQERGRIKMLRLLSQMVRPTRQYFKANPLARAIRGALRS